VADAVMHARRSKGTVGMFAAGASAHAGMGTHSGGLAAHDTEGGMLTPAQIAPICNDPTMGLHAESAPHVIVVRQIPELVAQPHSH